MKINTIKRKYGRVVHIFKRFVLPFGLLYLVFYLFTASEQQLPQEQDYLIIPGEALDPILKANSPRESSTKTVETFENAKPIIEPHHAPQINGLNGHEKKNGHTMEELAKVEPKVNFLPAEGNMKKPVPYTDVKDNEIADNKPREHFIKKKEFDDSDVPGRIETPWSMAKANIPDMEKVRFKGHAITNDTVTLTLMSSADKVFISINKKQIYKGINHRGLHVVVLNQYSARVMARRVFDTFQVGMEEAFVDFIDDITPGRIIVLAVLDEISSKLTWKGRSKLKELGSRFSEKISYRDMWAMVTRKDGLKIAETFSNVATADTGYEWGGPIFMRTDFDLEEHPVECKWPYNERNQARRLFCVRYEGYGSMCRCDVTQWNEVFFDVNKKLDKELSSSPLYNDLAVIILATNRSHSLYKTLKSLFEAPGFNKDMTAIYAEWPTKEVLSLAKLFGVTIVETKNYANTSVPAKIRHKMLRVFRDIMGAQFLPEVVPLGGLPDDVIPPFSAKNILLLEEDIVVAVDIFKYLHAMYPLLEKDETILGISAFNYHGYRDVVESQTRSFRTSDAQSLAILLPEKTVSNVLVPNWPTLSTEFKEWFHGLEVVMKEGKKDLIYPEITRAKHIGYHGYTVEGAVQQIYFKDHMISLSLEYTIPQQEIDRLILDHYDKEVKKILKISSELDFKFCTYDLGFGKNPHVVYLDYDGRNDTNWCYMMKCLKTWSAYPVGGWRNIWQFTFHGHPLTIVGVPASPYSSFKSANYKLQTAPANLTAPSTTTTTSSTKKSA